MFRQFGGQLMRGVRRAITYLGAALIGAAVGGYVSWVAFESRAHAAEFAQTAAFSVYVETQRCRATSEAYEQALRDFIVHLQTARAAPQRIFSPDIYDFDLALAHARLASLASKRGSQSETTAHLNEAATHCASLRWHDCSPENMLAAVSRVEKEIPCASDTGTGV